MDALPPELQRFYERERERTIARLHDLDGLLGRAPTLESQKAKQQRLANEFRAAILKDKQHVE